MLITGFRNFIERTFKGSGSSGSARKIYINGEADSSAKRERKSAKRSYKKQGKRGVHPLAVNCCENCGHDANNNTAAEAQ